MRKGILYVLIFSLAVIFTLTCNQAVSAASSSPNNISVQTQTAQPAPQQTQTVNNGNNNQLELAKEQLRGDFYKERFDSLKWAFGIILGLVVTFVGYTAWRNDKTYKEAVADANKTLDRIQSLSDKAEGHCEKARNYEQQAQDKLASIETAVTSKLKDIDEQVKTSLEKIKEEGKKQIDESIKEGERQRKVSELWNKSLNYLDKNDFQSASNCLRQIEEDCNEKTSLVYGCWGVVLSGWAELKEGKEAEKFFSKAIEKFQKALEITPDDNETYIDWGKVLFDLAKLKEDKDKEDLLNQAEDKLLKAESIKTDSASYYLACLFGIRGDKDKCRQWLETAEKAGKLLTREHAMGDSDLKIVRDEEWFKKLRFKGE